MNADLFRELSMLPSGARQTIRAWCAARIEILRDELEAAGNERKLSQLQGGILELRTLLRAME